jgi:hypothetical protein
VVMTFFFSPNFRAGCMDQPAARLSYRWRTMASMWAMVVTSMVSEGAQNLA